MTTPELPLPDGFSWCGFCAGPTRPLTATEAAGWIDWAGRQIAEGCDPLEVLDRLGWPLEMTRRSVCTCEPADPTAEEPDRGYFVYKLFGANDRLLYVGMSRRLRSRLRQHYAERAGYVIRHEVIVCSSEREMVELEAELIRTLHPPLNDIGNGET